MKRELKKKLKKAAKKTIEFYEKSLVDVSVFNNSNWGHHSTCGFCSIFGAHNHGEIEQCKLCPLKEINPTFNSPCVNDCYKDLYSNKGSIFVTKDLEERYWEILICLAYNNLL